MSSLRDLRRLLAFDDWANTQVLNAVEPMAADVHRAVAWMAHVMAAKWIWFARVAGTTAPFPVNPELPAPDIRVQFAAGHEEWMRHLDGLTEADLDRVVRYSNLKGDPFQNTLAEILTHLGIHGQHHRGQCTAAIRQAGGSPPAIDYIHATRSGAV